MVAVRVSGWAKEEGFWLVKTVVEVAAWVTFCEIGEEVEAWKFASPLYLAVRV